MGSKFGLTLEHRMRSMHDQLNTEQAMLLAAIGLLKQEIENIQDLDQSAEILIRFLCAVPGWSEKNVQVNYTRISEG